jgi:hypothetical protein
MGKSVLFTIVFALFVAPAATSSAPASGLDMALFGQFLQKLKTTPVGDGNLLDHSMILYGGGLGNGNLHDHINLPVLVAGRGAGSLAGSHHFNYPDNTPMANLLLTMLDKAGVPTPEKIGDSTEHLSVT